MKLLVLTSLIMVSNTFAQSYTKTGVLPVQPVTLALQDACFRELQPGLGKDIVTDVNMIKGDVEQSVLFELASTEQKKLVICRVSNQGTLGLTAYKEAATKSALKKAIAGAENNAKVARFNQ